MIAQKIVRWLLALFLFFPAVSAGVVVSQVLYDPLGTESGGEAVELRNDGNTAVNISSWVLATEASTTDATIPENTMLQSGMTYLIADAGWNNSKDSASWKAADHEETITLANADSGIALKDSAGTIIDAVGWGNVANIKEGLFEGTPATEVSAGKALVRSKDTNNNAADFHEEEPSFFSGETIMLIVNITNTTQLVLPLGAVVLEDDSSEPGVQLKPVAGSTRTLHLEAYYNGTSTSITAIWFGKNTTFTKESKTWKAELPLEYWYAPGMQNILVSTESQNITIPVSILELKKIKLVTKTVALQASPGKATTGTITVQNQGNVATDVSWKGSDLAFGSQKIAFTNLQFRNVHIKPAETTTVNVTLNVPANTLPGEYRTILQMEE